VVACAENVYRHNHTHNRTRCPVDVYALYSLGRESGIAMKILTWSSIFEDGVTCLTTRETWAQVKF
jgi:hypothetical protein